MRSMHLIVACLLIVTDSPVMAVDLDKLPKLGDMTKKPLLGNVNKSLADQQIKDGQFEFKTGKAEFAAGNDKRVSGLMKILTENSRTLKSAFPNLHVIAEGHTDADGSAAANQKLSVARANTVCTAHETTVHGSRSRLV
jgi:outer membrane protein OmpA-like peptidoglycan-associated protein